MNPPVEITQIESRVCDFAAEQTGIKRSRVQPEMRLIQDVHLDSLAVVEFLMDVEDAFDVSVDPASSDPLVKSVFTRNPLRLRDVAEVVYMHQGAGRRERRRWIGKNRPSTADPTFVPFTQLSGLFSPEGDAPLFESLERNVQGYAIFRRRTDGMMCIVIPPAEVAMGADAPDASPDERPLHHAHIDAFLIDQEPVSTTAYCRFLNSIGPQDQALYRLWFLMADDDHRQGHLLLQQDAAQWRPLPFAQRWPMMLVSWFGANAYSLWANGRDWRTFDSPETDASFLPTEAQWEYAARGPEARLYPWGDDDPTPDRLCCALADPGQELPPAALPLADVNAKLGLSPFGCRHMAGNVWNWCRDYYSADFYARPDATIPNPLNRHATPTRSERGGSWVGPAFLCRTSYRRGRAPEAKGRCLGFRCTSIIPESF